MKFLGVIPARGGSKRIARKNLASCADKPLLAWTAEAALGCTALDLTVLSTDDAELAADGRRLGLAVPFVRPASLAADAAPMLPVLQHALSWGESQMGAIDAVVLLQPTSPLRTSRHVEEAIRLFRARTAASVVSVVEPSHRFNPWKLLIEDERGLRPFLDSSYRPGGAEQVELPRVYARNGPAILITRAAAIAAGDLYPAPSFPYKMSPEDSVDIDEPFDLIVADMLLRRRAQAESMPVRGPVP